MNKQVNKKDVLAFLKKYGYILFLSVTLLVTAIVMAIIVNKPTNTTPTDTDGIQLINPVINASIEKNYTDSTLLYNDTLKHWEAHRAITFTVPENADVFAVLDGTVKEIYSNYLEGTVVVIEHANKLTSVYGSLAENVNVKVGDIVKKGDVIGKASNTANAELNLGNHLRFQLLKNGEIVNPNTYLNLGNK